MAKLLKDRARKAVIENAVAFSSRKLEGGELHYALEVSESWKQSEKRLQYAVLLTKSEMLRVTSEWLKSLAQDEVKKQTP